MGDDSSILGKIITWAIIAVLAIVALKIIFGVLGFAAFLLFTVGPVLVVGWLAVKAWQAFSQPTT